MEESVEVRRLRGRNKKMKEERVTWRKKGEIKGKQEGGKEGLIGGK